MALVVNDRVKETSTTTGTGTLTLAGAVTGFETFSSAIGNANTTYYAIVNTVNSEFEVGLGTVGAGTLARTTIISSSNSDSAVDFAAGTKNVFVTLPASKSVILDSSGNIVANNGSNLIALNATQLTSGTVPDARFPATLPASNGSALTDLNATNLGSGTVPTARLGTGTASSTTFLAGDQTYKTITADITAVTAGTNLTGGGSSGDVTLNLADASTSAKGAASFSSDNFAASSGAITIKDLGVATAEIQDDAITLGKMAPGTDGNIISYDTSGNPVAVATGSSGQVLTSSGAGAVPSFQTPTVGDITAVTAGSGLTGGGTTGDVTLNVGAGTGIDVAADAISVDVSDFMANGSNNRVVTATGADAQNAEANLTFDGTNLDLPDNTKIRVGTGNDLEIYHDGSNSFIAGGSGNQTVAIKPGGTGSVLITNSAGDNIITQQGDAAHLHYNNASILATTAAGVVPGLNDTYDLGASGNVWRNLYTGDLHLSNEAKDEGNEVDGTKGNWTIQEGSEDLYILNNKSGKKYKFKLEEI